MVRVAVAIPVYCDRGFMPRLLASLSSQTYSCFDTIVINKPCPDPDRDPQRVIREFSDSLRVEVVEQRDGLIEEGINIVLGVVQDYDVALLIDEDAVALSDWVEKHVKLHTKYPDVGVVGGGNTHGVHVNRGALATVARKLLYRPIHRRLRGYASYFGKHGLFVYNPGNGVLHKTLDVGGFNMSFKPSALGRFRLPGATLRGFYFEKYMAMKAVLNGFASVHYGEALVAHAEETQESLTRSNREATALEVFLAPYMMKRLFNLKVNEALLKITLYQLRLRHRDRVHELGSKLAIWALENNPDPHEVRSKLRKYVGFVSLGH